MDTHSHRTNTNTNTVPSRPTTPLRPSSRTSLRSLRSLRSSAANSTSAFPHSSTFTNNPLAALEPAFAELADGAADLEANFMHLQLLHESLSRFNENFAAFLYGLNMNAFCVDFPEAPVAPDSFVRWRRARAEVEDVEAGGGEGGTRRTGRDMDPDVTVLSTGTSFVDHPATTASGHSHGHSHSERGTGRSVRGGTSSTRGGGVSSSSRGGSGVARGRGGTGTGRGGTASSKSRGSGIARGTTTTRGRAR